MPDINSLPLSNRSSPVSQSRLPPSPTSAPSGSPRVPRSPHIERRHSSLLRDLNSNEHQGGSGSGSGNSPTSAATQLSQPMFQSQIQHHRAPSLGEIHQELENEQEAQVNRLLTMIRQQQAQIQQLQSQSTQQSTSPQTQPDPSLISVASNPISESSSANAASTTAIAASTPGSSRRSSTVPSRSQSQVVGTIQQSQQTNPSSQSQTSPGVVPSPSSLSRQSSYRRSRSRTENRSQQGLSSSPSMHPHEAAPDWSVGHYGLVNRDRDELVYYQAEAAMVQRENQMLKGRIRELERQIQELGLRSRQGEDLAQPSDE